MSLDSNAVVLPGRGYIFMHDTPGQASPADTVSALNALDLEAATIATSWRNLGHTSRENSVTRFRDGGDVTTLGSWQADALFASTEAVTQGLTFNPLQFSNDVLKAYEGGGDISAEDLFDLPDSPIAQEKALFLVMVSGSTRAGLWVPKVALSAADGSEAAPDALYEFPLRATFLKMTAKPLARWVRLGLGTPD